jgi:hypothetical protein
LDHLLLVYDEIMIFRQLFVVVCLGGKRERSNEKINFGFNYLGIMALLTMELSRASVGALTIFDRMRKIKKT